MTPTLAEALRAHRADLLAALRDPAGPCQVCLSGIVVRTSAGPVVCPVCCPGVTGDRLVWRNDLCRWVDYATERAAGVQSCDPSPTTADDVTERAAAETLRAARAEMFMARVAKGAAVPDPVPSWNGRGEPPWVRDDRLTSAAADPAPEAGPHCRCGSAAFVDVSIHAGQSTRRDCARCGRFLDFVVWYGVTRPSRIAQDERGWPVVASDTSSGCGPQTQS